MSNLRMTNHARDRLTERYKITSDTVFITKLSNSCLYNVVHYDGNEIRQIVIDDQLILYVVEDNDIITFLPPHKRRSTKTGVFITELNKELYRVKKVLKHKKREAKKLSADLDACIELIEYYRMNLIKRIFTKKPVEIIFK